MVQQGCGGCHVTHVRPYYEFMLMAKSTAAVFFKPLAELQYSENIICKLFEKNITDKLAIVHGLMSCVV